MFLRSDTTTFGMLRDLKFHVFATESIPSLTMEQFAAMELSQRQRNVELAQQHLSIEYAADCWNALLERFVPLSDTPLPSG